MNYTFSREKIIEILKRQMGTTFIVEASRKKSRHNVFIGDLVRDGIINLLEKVKK